MITASNQREALRRYVAHVTPEPHVSIAAALLSLWDMPYSSRAMRFVVHVLQRAAVRGLDVLE